MIYSLAKKGKENCSWYLAHDQSVSGERLSHKGNTVKLNHIKEGYLTEMANNTPRPTKQNLIITHQQKKENSLFKIQTENRSTFPCPSKPITRSFTQEEERLQYLLLALVHADTNGGFSFLLSLCLYVSRESVCLRHCVYLSLCWICSFKCTTSIVSFQNLDCAVDHWDFDTYVIPAEKNAVHEA